MKNIKELSGEEKKGQEIRCAQQKNRERKSVGIIKLCNGREVSSNKQTRFQITCQV